MNSFWTGPEGIALRMTEDLRDQMMAVLTDADLSYNPGGDNPTFGELCVDIGSIEHTYLESFKTFKHDLTYPATDPGIATSVEKLQAWFKGMDTELNAIIEKMSDDELSQPVDRGGWSIPARVQAYVYREALFIFYGRASVYLRSLKRPVSQQWVDWIG